MEWRFGFVRGVVSGIQSNFQMQGRYIREIGNKMLSKEICQKCYQLNNIEWNYVAEDLWHECFYVECPVYPGVTVLHDPPEDCEFKTEHILKDVDKVPEKKHQSFNPMFCKDRCFRKSRYRTTKPPKVISSLDDSEKLYYPCYTAKFYVHYFDPDEGLPKWCPYALEQILENK